LNDRQLCGDGAHRSRGRWDEVIDERALALTLSWNAAEQIVEPERSQRALRSQDWDAYVVVRRPVNSNVRRLMTELKFKRLVAACALVGSVRAKQLRIANRRGLVHLS